MTITVDTGFECVVLEAQGFEFNGKELIVDDGNTSHVISSFVSFKAGSLNIPQPDIAE